MRKFFSIFALTAMCCAMTAQAEPAINYNYFDAAYQWTHADADGIKDANGLDSKLSIGLIDYLALEGGYSYMDSEADGVDFDLEEFRYGLVGYYPICPELQLQARAGGQVGTFDTAGYWDAKDGAYGGLGIRYLVTDTIELEGTATYSYYSGATSWEYEGVSLFGLTDMLAVKAGIGFNDDSDMQLTGGLRLAF